MTSPHDRKYLKTHEWAKQDNNLIIVGLSKFAVDELTDITYVDLPPVGKQIKAGEAFGEIESVKATSELYAPVGGKVVAVNDALGNDPGAVNGDPWEAGWLIKVEPNNPADFDGLLDAAEYDKQVAADH